MSGTSVSVEAKGFSRLDLLIGRLANPDFTELMESIGAMVETQTDVRLKSTKTAPDGTAWPALNPAYAKRKKKGGILELEGDLRDSLVHLVSGQTVEVGSNLIYAATHQFGDMEKRKIPQREFLGLSPENEQQINGLLDEWWRQQLGQG